MHSSPRWFGWVPRLSLHYNPAWRRFERDYRSGGGLLDDRMFHKDHRKFGWVFSGYVAMKYLFIALAMLTWPHIVSADGVTVRPALKLPEVMVAEPTVHTHPVWEPAPEVMSQRYLAIVQDRLGHLGTAEAEVRALSEVQATTIERMKTLILNLEQENASLKAASKEKK